MNPAWERATLSLHDDIPIGGPLQPPAAAIAALTQGGVHRRDFTSWLCPRHPDDG
ncbi:MAG TPA: hypothetical protein GYA08_05135 [Chloroflexi bacterium]|nr:hypothetical protein [Chloroflexota bacterium]